MSFVYILKTSSGKYYIGSTIDINKRITHHQGGYTPSTKRLGKVELVLVQQFNTLSDARVVERKLKNLKRKDYIEKIIKDGYIRIKPE